MITTGHARDSCRFGDRSRRTYDGGSGVVAARMQMSVDTLAAAD